MKLKYPSVAAGYIELPSNGQTLNSAMMMMEYGIDNIEYLF